ncbi:MAG: archease [Candidatus Stahlbacteria bacterium]|nr:MAG: archease [Candidatus Stahlbacteria bacterium]
MNFTPLTYQIIDHTADLGIIVKGPDVRNLFILAAQAMTDLMVEGDISKETVIKDVSLQGEDFPDLMVRWLGEILYLFDGENLIVNSIKIKSISPTKLKSTLTLTSFETEHHQVIREIKAVTYHQISVDKTKDGWQAKVIFDI